MHEWVTSMDKFISNNKADIHEKKSAIFMSLVNSTYEIICVPMTVHFLTTEMAIFRIISDKFGSKDLSAAALLYIQLFLESAFCINVMSAFRCNYLIIYTE